MCVQFCGKNKDDEQEKRVRLSQTKALMRGVRLIRTVVLRHTHIEEVVSGDLQLVSVENAGA